MQLLPGAAVYARARRHVVLDVVDHGPCRSVRLVPAAGLGPPVTLISPFDVIRPIAASDVPRPSSAKKAARACAAAVRRSHAASELRAAVDADIRILDYQLEPAMAIVGGHASRLLLADEVGLGKTIQAGLILAELRARHLLTRALILTPAGLRDQWAAELRDRFALEVVRIDAGELSNLQRALPPWVNPWMLPRVWLVSIDLLKRGELLPQLEHVTWDAVIVDEAHHAARGTDRHAAAALACARARVVVLLTATPHNGDAPAYADLCNLGALEGDDRPLRVFRRRRGDVTAGTAPRRVRVITANSAPAERALRALLRAYASRVRRESGGSAPARLAMIVLRKRALSGPAPLARSLARRLEALSGSAGESSSQQLAFDFGDTLGGELIPDDGEPGEVLSAPGLPDAAREREMLARLLDAARAAIPGASKVSALARALSRASEPVIVFTEYRDTLDDLRRQLAGIAGLEVLHGAMMPAERRQAVARFTAGTARVLLATDAAAEGLNLHYRCRWVVHHEAPWSPVRIEQRNGRVDRLGQSRRVHVWHLVAGGTEEAGILARLAQRSSAARLESSVVTTGAAEAARVAQLKRLPPADVRADRPLVARVRPRGASPWLKRGQRLAVFAGTVLDGAGRCVARLYAAIRGRHLSGCRKAASRDLGTAARASIAAHRRFARTLAIRERAIEAALRPSRTPAIQPALFDRRALAEAADRDAEAGRAFDEVALRRSVADGAARQFRVSIALVASFVSR